MKTISIVWTTDDILHTAQEMDIYLTDEEADKILYELAEHHDPQVGICWEVIEIYIEQYLDEKEQLLKNKN